MKKFLIIGAIILFAGLVINYSLGGFEPVKPLLISNNQTVIYGFHYEGGHSSDSLENQIARLRKVLTQSATEGTLTIINYTQAEYEKRGLLKQFIGISWADNSKHTTASLDTLTIEAYNGFQFRIPIKPLVMPSPEKLKRLAREAAAEMDADLSNFSIEQYKNKFLINNFPFK